MSLAFESNILGRFDNITLPETQEQVEQVESWPRDGRSYPENLLGLGCDKAGSAGGVLLHLN
jgi:hypothetical protein